GLVSGFPDHALQRLQRRGLAILIDPAQQGVDYAARAWIVDAGFAGRGVEPPQHLGIVLVVFDEARQPRTRVRKQHVLDERDRAGRALDVGEDGACAGCGHLAHAVAPPTGVSICEELALSISRFTSIGCAMRSSTIAVSPRPVISTLP